MKKTISRLAVLAVIMTPVGAYAANGDNPGSVASKGYVDSGLFQKANKTDVAAIKTVTDSVTSNDTVNKANAAQTATQVTTAITGALTNYSTTAQMDAAITTATNDMATQTWVDQQNYLTATDVSGKADAVTGAGGTGTKITYNTQGVVTGSTNAEISDVNGLQTALDAKATVTGLTALDERLSTFRDRAEGFATAAQGAQADATATALSTNDTIAKANSALQEADLDDYITADEADAAYDAAGSAAAVQSNLDMLNTTLTTNDTVAKANNAQTASDVSTAIAGAISDLDLGNTYDAKGAAAAAQAAAEAYADANDDDHITTVNATVTGAGNAITAIAADANGQLTLTKGETFLTAGDISNKMDKTTCADNEMLLADATTTSGFKCVPLELGTYTETVTP